jgi:hypothetical protein
MLLDIEPRCDYLYSDKQHEKKLKHDVEVK